MALAPGTKLGPYEIQSPLGAGGMGEVYRAKDTKLGRDVAIKVLPAGMATMRSGWPVFSARPSRGCGNSIILKIVTIYSVEESDGIHFLTMELIEGKSLDRMIPADGLPFEQIIEIASGELADALAAAHEKGIVHRDLKPANIMVTKEGRIKVLDFGLAKDLREAAPTWGTPRGLQANTKVGVVMGTIAYMSPEQIIGPPGRSSHRHFLAGRGAARDGNGTASVQWRIFGRVGLCDSAGHATIGY